MSSVVILGDPHVGKNVSQGKAGIGSNLNSRVVDQLNLLDWTLDQAVEAHADNIIITGDVFEDPKPHPSLITLFIGWLKKCQLHNIHVHIIMGNHDVIRCGSVNMSSLDIITEMDLDLVTVYKNITTIFINTSAFTLIPYRDRKFYGTMSNSEALATLRESLVYELASIPLTYQKFVVGHLALEGSIPVGDEIDDVTNELFCPLDMFEGYDCVWMGHVHKPQVMKKVPFLSHIGSMDISNFGETNQKKYIVVLDAEKTTPTPIWNNLTLPTRTLKNISVVVPSDVEDSTKYVLDELEKIEDLDKATVKVEVSLSSPDLKPIVKSDVEKYLVSHGVFNVTSISQSKKAIVAKKTANNVMSTKMDVPVAINTYAELHVPEEHRADFITLSLEIYNQHKIEAKE
jgi:DNA repair exonuclease SbcCD nuclease subunit